MEQSTRVSGTWGYGEWWLDHWEQWWQGAKKANENCISQAPQESSHAGTTAFCVCLSTASPMHASLCSTYVSIPKITCEKCPHPLPHSWLHPAPVLNLWRRSSKDKLKQDKLYLIKIFLEIKHIHYFYFFDSLHRSFSEITKKDPDKSQQPTTEKLNSRTVSQETSRICSTKLL